MGRSRPRSRFQFQYEEKQESQPEQPQIQTVNESNKQLQFFYALEENNSVVLSCDNTSATIFHITNTLINGGWTSDIFHIALVHSRQLAVLSTALYLTQQRGHEASQIGGEVGYVLDHYSKRSKQSKILLYTTDSLINTIATDPLLSTISVIILLDASERGIQSDLLVALLQQLRVRRTELRLVLCASFEKSLVQQFLSYLSPSTNISIYGHDYPVKVMQVKQPVKNYIESAISAVQQIYRQWLRDKMPVSKNVLVFVPGADDAENLCTEINQWAADEAGSEQQFLNKRKRSADGRMGRSLLAMPLYTSLPHTRQVAAARDTGEYGVLKVVVSTNIAETAVNVQGISNVIDCGYEKLKIYDAKTGIASLCVVPISQATAQRRSRAAGKDGPGVCFRLYTVEWMKKEMAETSVPEMLYVDLTPLVVRVKTLGLKTSELRFMTDPPRESLAAAVGRLYNLQIISMDGKLMAGYEEVFQDMSLGVNIVRSIRVGEELGVGRFIVAIAAMLRFQHIFTRAPKKTRDLFSVAEGDLVTLLNVWRRYVAGKCSDAWCVHHRLDAGVMRAIRAQFRKLMKMSLERMPKSDKYAIAKRRMGLTTIQCVQRAIAAGFAEHAAMVQPDGSYLLALSGRRARIDHTSVLSMRMPKWIVYATSTQHDDIVKLRDVTVIEASCLVEVAPNMYERFVE